MKDVRLDVLRDAADWDEAWRGGVFCELGTGDVDLEGFFAELDGYDGWLVVEQDWVPRPGGRVRRAGGGPGPEPAVADRARRSLREITT